MVECVVHAARSMATVAPPRPRLDGALHGRRACCGLVVGWCGGLAWVDQYIRDQCIPDQGWNTYESRWLSYLLWRSLSLLLRQRQRTSGRRETTQRGEGGVRLHGRRGAARAQRRGRAEIGAIGARRRARGGGDAVVGVGEVIGGARRCVGAERWRAHRRALCGGAPLAAGRRGLMLSRAGRRVLQGVLQRVLLRVLHSVQRARSLL